MFLLMNIGIEMMLLLVQSAFYYFITMGTSLGCCPSVLDEPSFKGFCISHASPNYRPFLLQIINAEVPQKGDIILGQWQDSQSKTGKGVIYSPQQFYYEGDIVDSKAYGHGKIIWFNKIIYTGNIANNQANGEGELSFQDEEMSLKGPWQSGEPVKNQKFLLINKKQKSYITIIGIRGPGNELKETQSDILKVKIEFEQGHIYEGEVKRKKNNQFTIQGLGKLTFPDASVYNGEFLDGKMHGIGRYDWASTGHWFEGEYKKNFKDGQGVYFFSAENFKKGIWRAGNLLQAEAQKLND